MPIAPSGGGTPWKTARSRGASSQFATVDNRMQSARERRPAQDHLHVSTRNWQRPPHEPDKGARLVLTPFSALHRNNGTIRPVMCDHQLQVGAFDTARHVRRSVEHIPQQRAAAPSVGALSEQGEVEASRPGRHTHHRQDEL